MPKTTSPEIHNAHDDIRRLLALLASNDARLICQSAKGLSELRATEAIPRLMELLRHSHNRVVCSAAIALGQLQAPQAIPRLVQLLNHDCPVVVALSAVALGKLQSVTAIPEIVQLLDHDNLDVVAFSIWSLSALRATHSVPRIIRFLDHPDPKVLQYAASSLGVLLATQAIPRLMELLEHSNASVVAHSASALGLLGAIQAVPRLIEFLHHDSPEVIGFSAAALGRLQATQAVHRLIELLKHDDAFVVTSSAFALRILRATEATPRLIELLHHPTPDVVAYAALALGQFQATGAIRRLKELVMHPNNFVGAYSAIALCNLDATNSAPQCVRRLVDTFHQTIYYLDRRLIDAEICSLPPELQDHMRFVALVLDPQEDRRLARLHYTLNLQTIQNIFESVLNERCRCSADFVQVRSAAESEFWLAAKIDPLFRTPMERVIDDLFPNIRSRLSGAVHKIINHEHLPIRGKKTINGKQQRVWQNTNYSETFVDAKGQLTPVQNAQVEAVVELYEFLKNGSRNGLVSARQERLFELLFSQRLSQEDAAELLGVNRRTVGRDLRNLKKVIRAHFPNPYVD